MRFFNQLFRKQNHQSRDWKIEDDLVEEYVSVLPQCSRDVVIACPKYRNKHYTCEVIVPTIDLLKWAQKHVEGTVSGSRKNQLTRQALPIWLGRANYNDESKAYLPGRMDEVLRDYVTHFVQGGVARIFCFECNSLLNQIQVNDKKRTLRPGWNRWTDDWVCNHGHQLYKENHEMHLHCRS